jgi:hypothetical protein
MQQTLHISKKYLGSYNGKNPARSTAEELGCKFNAGEGKTTFIN